MSKGRFLKITGLILLSILIIGGVGFVIWASDARGPMDEALAYLESTDTITVTDSDDTITFAPQNYTLGFIYYPGGKVEPRSYAPLMHMIADEGYLVVLVKMPLNLAVFKINAANDIIEEHTEVETWAIGGHSLGGTMAASYLSNNLDTLQSLVLMGSYPASSNDFSSLDVNVLSIYGTEDLGLDGIESSRTLLPSSTTYVVIDGGNHAQFGYYGLQNGDGTATVSREYQHEIAVNATTSFFESISA